MPLAATPDARFREALAHYQQGRLADADAGCRQVLREQPHHFEALYLLGLIALQTRRPQVASELFTQVIALRPEFAEAWNSRGAALAELGRIHDALSDYDRAIELKPDHFFAYNNRGGTLARLGRFEAALSSYRHALALQPDSAHAYINLGVTLAKLGRAAEALANFDKSLALQSDNPVAHYNRGNALRDLQRHADAVASYDRAIALQPHHAEAHNNRGAALAVLGRAADALSSYRQAVAVRPEFVEAHNNVGSALVQLDRLEEALQSHDRAIALKPDHVAAHKNRGNVLAGLGRLDDALAAVDQAIALQPDFAEAHADRGAILANLGRRVEALASFDRTIALKPDSLETRFNKAVCQLTLGDYEPGWVGYEWRWATRHAEPLPELPGLLWRGDSDIANQVVLVHAEQGFGDSLQFCRYIPMLARIAGKVVLDVRRPLARLLSGLEGVSEVITHGDPLPPFDAWIPMLSLPLAFRTTLATVPATVPYLSADADQTARWRERLAALPGRKVGLVWAGSPFSPLPRAAAMDRRRSISLQHFAPLADLPGLCLISLQKGDAAAQTRTLPAGMMLHDWTDELEDFADTAALVAALDLVISVDTAVAHLAGALAKPVWVLNRFDQCWRWLQDRSDSPWYPTARLFRQPAPGEWSSVIRQVTQALGQTTP